MQLSQRELQQIMVALEIARGTFPGYLGAEIAVDRLVDRVAMELGKYADGGVWGCR